MIVSSTNLFYINYQFTSIICRATSIIDQFKSPRYAFTYLFIYTCIVDSRQNVLLQNSLFFSLFCDLTRYCQHSHLMSVQLDDAMQLVFIVNSLSHSCQSINTDAVSLSQSNAFVKDELCCYANSVCQFSMPIFTQVEQLKMQSFIAYKVFNASFVINAINSQCICAIVKGQPMIYLCFAFSSLPISNSHSNGHCKLRFITQHGCCGSVTGDAINW